MPFVRGEVCDVSRWELAEGGVGRRASLPGGGGGRDSTLSLIVVFPESAFDCIVCNAALSLAYLH